MAFELFTKEAAFSMIEGKGMGTALHSPVNLWGNLTYPLILYKGIIMLQVMDRIEGVNGLMLPWERDTTPAVRRQLGVFKDSVLQLLSRESATGASTQA